jgi:hypothetical protein
MVRPSWLTRQVPSIKRSKLADSVLDLSRPIEADQEHGEDPTAPARGIVIGIVISAALWALIIAALI